MLKKLIFDVGFQNLAGTAPVIAPAATPMATTTATPERATSIRSTSRKRPDCNAVAVHTAPKLVAAIIQPRIQRWAYAEDEGEEAEGERRGCELRRAREQLQNLCRPTIPPVT